MGYLMDAVVCLAGCVIVLVALNFVFGDIYAKDSIIYWGVWVVGGIAMLGKWGDRGRKDKMKRTILEDQYNQAVERAEQQESNGR